MISVGIAGIGHVARHQMAAIDQSDDFMLVACCDQDQKRLDELAPSATTFTQIDQMLRSANIDVVVVATPNSLHVEHGIQALSSGKWLLMEKPAADSRHGFDQLARARTDRRGREGRGDLGEVALAVGLGDLDLRPEGRDEEGYDEQRRAWAARHSGTVSESR